MQPHFHHCTHGVLFYKDEDTMGSDVASFIGTALRAGNPAIVIAKPQVRARLAIELHRQHVQGTPFGEQRGRLVLLDAEETLSQFCVDGRPDAAMFRVVVGEAIAALRAPGRRIAAYGDMVDVLCQRGQYTEAIRLEAMWDELLAKEDAALLCGYQARLFTSPAGRSSFDAIRAAHAHSCGET
ncbi:MAG TPA: MEDS domain-containing protein [Ramlibacter sp.]|nr:MEDS domain-containing protein [Ramlibacter sp.]